jgi:small subunit ribosomal protein S21
MYTALRQDARVWTDGKAPSRTGVAVLYQLAIQSRKEPALKVFVRDNNVDQALRVLKKKLQREGLFRELKRRKAYEKPSERRAREKGEAIRRGRKAARKLAEREGLIAKPRVKRPVFGRS